MGATPSLCWHMPRKEKVLYLSFDDGPHPEITLEVLDLLRQHQAKATFFCVGQNVERHPEVVQQCLAEGHSVGNHTHRHLNGWKHSAQVYLKDIAEAESALQNVTGAHSRLFRPPYGRLGLTAWRRISQQYRVVMWDVIAGDFVQDWSAERVEKNVLGHAQAGSIVVLHDSEKCHKRMIPALKSTLLHFEENGFRFEVIPQG